MMSSCGRVLQRLGNSLAQLPSNVVQGGRLAIEALAESPCYIIEKTVMWGIGGTLIGIFCGASRADNRWLILRKDYLFDNVNLYPNCTVRSGEKGSAVLRCDNLQHQTILTRAAATYAQTTMSRPHYVLVGAAIGWTIGAAAGFTQAARRVIQNKREQEGVRRMMAAAMAAAPVLPAAAPMLLHPPRAGAELGSVTPSTSSEETATEDTLRRRYRRD